MRNTIKLSAIISLLFTTQISYSQNSFSIKTGVNVATTRDLIAFPENRLGYYLGFEYQLKLKRKFHLQSALLYSSKGYSSTNYSDNSSTKFVMDYINIPLLLGYRIDQKTSINVGVETGYLLFVNMKMSNGEKFNVSDSYPVKLDVGLSVGAKHTFFQRFGIEISYIYGLNRMYTTDAIGVRRGEISGGNRVFQSGLYYILK